MKPRFKPMRSRQVPAEVKQAVTEALPWSQQGWRRVVRRNAEGKAIGEYAARVDYKRRIAQIKGWYYAEMQ